MITKPRPNINKLVNNASSILKMKSDSPTEILPSTNLVFIRRSQLNLKLVSPPVKNFYSPRILRRSPSPEVLESMSPLMTSRVQQKHCAKIHKIINTIENFQSDSKKFKRSGLKPPQTMKVLSLSPKIRLNLKNNSLKEREVKIVLRRNLIN